MLFARQRLLLSLLDALGGTVANTDFQKLLFLYAQEWETEPSYEFVPYQFGGFSFTSYADKRRLIEQDLLVADEQHWTLTAAGRAAAQSPAASRLSRFAQAVAGKRGDTLIAEVYRRHPWYATRSKIAERVLPQATDRAAIAAARPAPQGPGLVTIGYEGRSLENYRSEIERMREYARNRPRFVRQQLQEQFGLSEAVELGVTVTGAGAVKVNSIEPDAYPWSGFYFREFALTLTALPAPGYRFAGWQGDIIADEATIVFHMEGATKLCAAFEQIPDAGGGGAN